MIFPRPHNLPPSPRSLCAVDYVHQSPLPHSHFNYMRTTELPALNVDPPPPTRTEPPLPLARIIKCDVYCRLLSETHKRASIRWGSSSRVVVIRFEAERPTREMKYALGRAQPSPHLSIAAEICHRRMRIAYLKPIYRHAKCMYSADVCTSYIYFVSMDFVIASTHTLCRCRYARCCCCR